LLLLRHGESTWNAERRWQGRADPPLSTRGERQAVEAIRPLAELGDIAAVVTSSLQRARRTGEVLAEGLGIELSESEPGLDERSAGPWEGMTRDEIHRDYPGFLDVDRRPAGYESDAALLGRVVPALRRAHERASRRAQGRIVVVSHGGVIGAVERHADAATSGERPPGSRFDNLEGRWFTLDADGFAALGDRVLLVGDREADGPGVADAHYL
jgi:probable phosphoglycerate mutase